MGITKEYEFREECVVTCLSLHCRNELVHHVDGKINDRIFGEKRVKTIIVSCEESLSCIAKIRIDGAQSIAHIKDDNVKKELALNQIKEINIFNPLGNELDAALSHAS